MICMKNMDFFLNIAYCTKVYLYGTKKYSLTSEGENATSSLLYKII